MEVTYPQYYGSAVEENGEYAWIFLEYIVGVPLTRNDAAHQRAAARWLGHLHTAAERHPSVAQLPDRGSRYYFDHLLAARESIVLLLEQPRASEISSSLSDILEMLDRLRSRWPLIAESCSELPRTLVHGDFVPKNIRVLADDTALRIYPFDWETADLVFGRRPEWRKYCRLSGGHPQSLDPLFLPDLEWISLVGRLFDSWPVSIGLQVLSWNM